MNVLIMPGASGATAGSSSASGPSREVTGLASAGTDRTNSNIDVGGPGPGAGGSSGSGSSTATGAGAVGFIRGIASRFTDDRPDALPIP